MRPVDDQYLVGLFYVGRIYLEFPVDFSGIH